MLHLMVIIMKRFYKKIKNAIFVLILVKLILFFQFKVLITNKLIIP